MTPVARRTLVTASLASSWCLLMAVAVAGRQPAVSSLDSLLEAERSFARLSGKIGQLPAFLAYFADDVVTFQPLPAAGKEGLRKAALAAPHPATYSLDWEPWTGGIAADGDLGYTTGPTRSAEAATGRPLRTGWYFSVWKHDALGWRVIADTGVSAPPVAALRPAPVGGGSTGSGAAPPAAGPLTKEMLLAAEREMCAGLVQGTLVAVYAPRLDPGIRLYREGAEPAVGVEAGKKVLAGEPVAAGWRVAGAGVSSSGDLGYSYGVYDVPVAGGGTPKRSFLHVWKASPAGWRLAAEVIAGR